MPTQQAAPRTPPSKSSSNSGRHKSITYCTLFLFIYSTTTSRRFPNGLLRRNTLFTGFYTREHTNLLIRPTNRLRHALNAMRDSRNNLTILTITTSKLTRLLLQTSSVRRVIRSLRRRASTMNMTLRLPTLNLINLHDNDTRLSNYISRHTNLITISRTRLLFNHDRDLVFRVRLLTMSRTTTTHANSRHPNHPRVSSNENFSINSSVGHLNRRSVANRRNHNLTGYLITKKLTPTRIIIIRTKRIIISRQVTIRRLRNYNGLINDNNVTIRRVTSNRRRCDASTLSTTRRTMTNHATSIQLFKRVNITNDLRHDVSPRRVLLVLLYMVR